MSWQSSELESSTRTLLVDYLSPHSRETWPCQSNYLDADLRMTDLSHRRTFKTNTTVSFMAGNWNQVKRLEYLSPYTPRVYQPEIVGVGRKFHHLFRDHASSEPPFFDRREANVPTGLDRITLQLQSRDLFYHRITRSKKSRDCQLSLTIWATYRRSLHNLLAFGSQ